MHNMFVPLCIHDQAPWLQPCILCSIMQAALFAASCRPHHLQHHAGEYFAAVKTCCNVKSTQGCVLSSYEFFWLHMPVLHSGFQLANVVEAVRAGCKLPLPYSHGLPAALQASAHAAPVTHQICKHMARQLAGICDSAVWLRHLEQVSSHTQACTPTDGSAPPACNPKQGKLPVALDTATPQRTADNQGAASLVKLQPVTASQDAASPVKLQPLASQVGNAATHLNGNLAVTAVPSSASAGIAAKAGVVADATGQLPHQPAAAACCKNDIHRCEAHLPSQQQGPCAARAASRLEPPAAPLTAVDSRVDSSNLFSLHTAPAAPSSKQEDAKSGLNGTHRRQSSILYRHQHCLRERPAGSYSMKTSGSSRPPWDSSSQGTQSVKCSASIGKVEDAGGGDTDSPQAVCRSVKLLSDLGYTSCSAPFALSWLFLVHNIFGIPASLLSVYSSSI